MSKAILIMDMPESCFGCNFMHCDEEYEAETCQATEVAKDIDLIADRPDWCPLRELPEKETDMTDADDLGVDYVRGTMDGWNNCLDAIINGATQ